MNVACRVLVAFGEVAGTFVGKTYESTVYGLNSGELEGVGKYFPFEDVCSCSEVEENTCSDIDYSYVELELSASSLVVNSRVVAKSCCFEQEILQSLETVRCQSSAGTLELSDPSYSNYLSFEKLPPTLNIHPDKCYYCLYLVRISLRP